LEVLAIKHFDCTKKACGAIESDKSVMSSTLADLLSKQESIEINSKIAHRDDKIMQGRRASTGGHRGGLQFTFVKKEESGFGDEIGRIQSYVL
jgi:hypothetical protein